MLFLKIIVLVPVLVYQRSAHNVGYLSAGIGSNGNAPMPLTDDPSAYIGYNSVGSGDAIVLPWSDIGDLKPHRHIPVVNGSILDDHVTDSSNYNDDASDVPMPHIADPSAVHQRDIGYNSDVKLPVVGGSILDDLVNDDAGTWWVNLAKDRYILDDDHVTNYFFDMFNGTMNDGNLLQNYNPVGAFCRTNSPVSAQKGFWFTT